MNLEIPPLSPATERYRRPRKPHPGAALSTQNLQAALDKAMAASAAYNLPGPVSVNEALDRWLKLHSIGVKPSSNAV